MQKNRLFQFGMFNHERRVIRSFASWVKFAGYFAFKGNSAQTPQVFSHIWLGVVEPAHHVTVSGAFSRHEVVSVTHQSEKINQATRHFGALRLGNRDFFGFYNDKRIDFGVDIALFKNAYDRLIPNKLRQSSFLKNNISQRII